MQASSLKISNLSPVQLGLRIASILGFTFATALAAHIRFELPFTVVPVTLQTAIVLLAGLRLGWRDGAFSQALYIGAGAIGLPFFAGVSGLAVLVGPTGGYLAGFVLAALVAGQLNRNSKSFLRGWISALLASIVIFVTGALQLKVVMNLTWAQTLTMGVLPFVLGDLLKITFAAAANSVSRKAC